MYSHEENAVRHITKYIEEMKEKCLFFLSRSPETEVGEKIAATSWDQQVQRTFL